MAVATEQLATMRAALATEHAEIMQLAKQPTPGAFLKHARKWLRVAAWIGCGEVYTDKLIPMRTDLEKARFGKEITLRQGDDGNELWFEVQSCVKTKRRIAFSFKACSPKVHDVLLVMHQVHCSRKDSGWLWPKRDDTAQARSYHATRRSEYCESLGFAEGARCITAWRHITRRDMPPRTPDEAADMAMRRGSSVEAMNRYGVWREG